MIKVKLKIQGQKFTDVYGEGHLKLTSNLEGLFSPLFISLLLQTEALFDLPHLPEGDQNIHVPPPE